MATSELARPHSVSHDEASAVASVPARLLLAQALGALASLRLTVALFACSIFLVFAGTLAQVDHGVWYVVDHTYFRVWFARVEWLALERLIGMFTDVDGVSSGGFLFPGGKLLGSLLLVNLLAAHAVRFKVSARGRRLGAGLATVALGLVVTALVIQSGMNDTIESELTPQFCNVLWQSFRASVAGLALLGAYLLVLRYGSSHDAEWWLMLAVDAVLVAVAAWLLLDPETQLDDAGLRILWQLVKGLAAGAVLLAGCVMAFGKRAGIVLLHGGVALLMGSELVTGLTANEARMSIAEGQTVNYASDIRTTELAMIDRSDADEDLVTVVPAALLSENVVSEGRIEDAELPVGIKVHRWLANAQLRRAAASEPNPVTAGSGLGVAVDEIPSGSGVDTSSAVDQPAAYVELFAKDTGRSLGTYLVAIGLPDQSIDVGGKTLGLGLRFKRIYYPYSLTNVDFSFDRYVGTNTAKNYSTLARLTDPARNVDREVKIWMNNPLRYAGVTFYQADFDHETEQTTVLQVVTNPGWMAPYVACMLVATGMLAHFGVTLTRFLRRRAEDAAKSEPRRPRLRSANGAGFAGGGTMPMFAKWFPALIVLVFAAYLGSKTRMPESEPNQMQIYQFGKLPLAYQGRVKPYDTLARNTLQILSTRQEVLHEDTQGRQTRVPAIRWLLDVISGAPAAEDHRVFRVENLELLDTLGLPHRELSWRYSWAELEKSAAELDRQIALAERQPENERSLFQRSVLDLARKRNLYLMTAMAFRSPPLSGDRDTFADSLQRTQLILQDLQRGGAPHAVPPIEPTGRWTPLMEAEFDLLRSRALSQAANPATIALGSLLEAYRRGDVTTFNRQLADYRRVLRDYQRGLEDHAEHVADAGLANAEILSLPKINFEVFYNQFSPFYYAAVLYLVAFVLGVASWLGWSEPLRRASIWLLVFTFAVHTLALAGRIYVSGRPPITNLYSTAIFIGWAGVLFGLVFELFHRLGLGNIVAAVIGFLTLLVAHNLSLDGDTFIVLQAVLDTQFWLATHVVTINLGYATTYLAGALGIAYVLFAHVFRQLDDHQQRQLTRMTYGTLCFAIFFSFVGTVLGGLWADDSWGRFWGWDPKENGALIIVLYNALVLHARWGAMVAGRGLALLAIGGNIVTTWSYFGTNELGVGLHAYGASESSTAMWLLTFAASQAALITLGAIPRDGFASLVGRRASNMTP